MSESTNQIIDQILVMDAQDGKVKAMEMLVSRWQRRLWHYAYGLTGNSEAAWDITQESWLGIIKGLRKLHDPANFKAWAYRITTNKSVDWIKRNKVGKQVSIEEIQEPQHKARKDIGVKELLERLDMKKRIVVSLYYFEQLSVTEVGAALCIPKGTVKSRLANAREELKKLWQQSIG